jgi:dipeptide transport system ATP-binding protein
MTASMAGAPLLEALDLTRHYPVSRGWFAAKGVVRALDGVSFVLREGETLAIVGESGCGKSTLARQVTMIERPTTGALVIAGENIAHASGDALRRLRSQVQMVFQNPYASLNPRKKIGTLLEEPLAINGRLDRSGRREAARSMLRKVGLRPEHYGRYPHMFSGGQRQRIAVARALMLRPRLVVADEPVSALDVSIQAQVLNLLMDLQQELGMAYLFISHNLQVVRHIADSVAVMYFGKIVEHGPKSGVLERPLHPYTRALLASTPVLTRRTMPALQSGASLNAEGLATASATDIGTLSGELPSPLAPPSGCSFHARCPYAINRCIEEVPQLVSLGNVRVACHRAAELAPV